MPLDLRFSELAVRSDISPARWRLPFIRWLDGIEEGWAVPGFLVGFVFVWTCIFVIAYPGGDLHTDVLEAWSLGREFAWGNSKHPPLMGWVARAWTSVFPLTDWSFHLLAMTNSALALWAVDLITRQFASGDKRGDKRIVVLLLLMLLPTYQIFAQRFNANTVLLALWPLATYCFLRSFETRQLKWAIAAGLTAALAMLGKYYSAFLVGSFVFAALCHPQRRIYFGSLTPWVSAFVGCAALAPHLDWLATTGAMPIAYALAERSGKSLAAASVEVLYFILGLALVFAIPAAVWMLIAGPRLRMVSHDFRKMRSGLLLLFFIAIGTIAFPTITSILLGTDLPVIWALQGLFLFVVLSVCGTTYSIERFYSVNLAFIVIAFAWTALVVLAPIHAYYRNFHPLGEGRSFYRLSVTELTRRWHAETDVPLPAVGGDEGLAFATAFYSPDHPAFVASLVCPRANELPKRTISRGWAALCFADDPGCIDRMNRVAARSPRVANSEFVVQSVLWGQPGATRRLRAFVVPPTLEDLIVPSIDELYASRCRRKQSVWHVEQRIRDTDVPELARNTQ